MAKTKGDETDAEVLVEPSNRFRKKLTDIRTLERKQVVMEVEMTDTRQPLKWYKNGEEIQPSERIHIKYRDEKYTLTIDNCTLEDAGEYMAATRDIKTKGKLTVDEAERAPIIKYDDTDITADVGRALAIEIPYTGKYTTQYATAYAAMNAIANVAVYATVNANA